MIDLKTNFTKTKKFLLFFVIFLITFDKSLFSYNYTNYERNVKIRNLSEKRILYKSSDLSENDKMKRNMFDDEYCKIAASGFFSNIRNNIRKAFTNNLENCLNAQYHKQLIDNFKNILENTTITKTKVCLIDTGINENDEILREHFSNPKDYGINTEDCKKDNYLSCGTSNIEDVNNHGSFIADTIINNNMSRKSGSYNQQATLSICKASGNPQKCDLYPLMKCLNYCQMKEAKVIHISFNVNENDDKLRKIIQDLKKKGTIIVLPAQKGCVPNSVSSSKTENDILLASASMENTFRRNISNNENNNTQACNMIYPSIYSYRNDNVFSVGSMNFVSNYIDNINDNLIPYKRNSFKWNTSFFNFTYKFNKYHKYDAKLFESTEYASASFANTLLIMYNIYPEITVEQINSILKKSIIRNDSLKKYSKFGGYLNVVQMIQELFNEKRTHS